ncbi:Holliday junction branch migration protein RuvA [Catelliglobosispora koreensis]|uniref:Holliday junction branch migration protein RuvA n=1 Tax=Catelliglobosispora koreensis TaxID=129052 RepID=UPI000370AA09|nr:Holliday junction branch migration protein RuvA [Catelliglobosispora koreensis]
MIASVSGVVASVGAEVAVVEVGGIGLALHCAPPTLASLRVGRETRLAAALIVREDSLTLFGFASEDEKQLFELLLTASGVGPKIAVAALSVHTPEALRAAISQGDLSTLTQVPGIGKKGAERIVLELRDKVGPVSALPVQGGRSMAWTEQVRQGLVGLGWSMAQADQAVAAVAETIDGTTPPVPVLLKQAIRLLGKNK